MARRNTFQRPEPLAVLDRVQGYHLEVSVDGEFAYNGVGKFSREYLELWVKGPMAGLAGSNVTYRIVADA